MLKLRLKRTGRKNDPSFRIVVTESTAPPKGKYLESVGSYKPSLKQLSLDKERVEYWLSKGIRPTDVVHNILVKEGVLKDSKKSVHSTRIRKKKEGDESEDKGKAPVSTGSDVEASAESVKEEVVETPAKTENESPKEEPQSEPDTDAETESKSAGENTKDKPNTDEPQSKSDTVAEPESEGEDEKDKEVN